MAITRIIPGIQSCDLAATRDFYCGLLGMVTSMEEGDFLMMNSDTVDNAQMIVNDNGHPGLPPGFAVDIDDAERVRTLHAEMTQRGFAIVEPLTDKPWGIRRFSVIDPNGVRVTIISHIEASDGGA
jgi:uncharacterized glyoxalase superfamily protein PhnB